MMMVMIMIFQVLVTEKMILRILKKMLKRHGKNSKEFKNHLRTK